MLNDNVAWLVIIAIYTHYIKRQVYDKIVRSNIILLN